MFIKNVLLTLSVGVFLGSLHAETTLSGQGASWGRVLLGGQDSAAAVLHWDYELKLDPKEHYILKRTLKWEVLDSQSLEKLHDSQQIHYFKITQQRSYKRADAAQNLWRTEAYSASAPVVDGKAQGEVLNMPRIRRGAEPTEEQKKQIEEYVTAFSSRNTKGWVSIEDEFFKVNESFEGDFYKFPTLVRSGPWTSDVYPLGPIHNLRRDYADFLKYLHATKIHSELPAKAIQTRQISLEWETGPLPKVEDFKIK